ncbi:MAG TPA: hypothetical protein VGL59_12285 [Polyangia bacterium]
MFSRRGLILLSVTILLSCGGKSLDAVTGGDSGADNGGGGGAGGAGTGGASGTGGISGTSGASGTGGHNADSGAEQGSGGGADAGNGTASLPDTAIDRPKDAGTCPATIPTSGSFCSETDLGTMCKFGEASASTCTCSAGDLITIWKCTPMP